MTSGYAAACAYFHPIYKPGTRFRYLGRQRLETGDVHIIAFAQNPEKAVLQGVFKFSDFSLLLLMQGIAWIDPETGEIRKIRTDLLSPLEQVGLLKHSTEVTFGPVSLGKSPRQLWLPLQVNVAIDWRNVIYRNSHRYSDYAFFSAESIGSNPVPIKP
jgi:hypothetical protein